MSPSRGVQADHLRGVGLEPTQGGECGNGDDDGKPVEDPPSNAAAAVPGGQ